MPPQLMRLSDTPPSHHTVVNGRIAGISPNHSYSSHSQGEKKSFLIPEFETFNVQYCVKSYSSLFNQHHQVGYRVEG
jgi:hypothetical protein